MVKKPRKAASGSAARAPRRRQANRTPSPLRHEPPALASDDDHSPPARSDEEQTEQKPRKSRKMKAASMANLQPGVFGRPIHHPVPRLPRSPAARADREEPAAAEHHPDDVGEQAANPPAAPDPPSPDAFVDDWYEPDYGAAPPTPALSDVSDPGSDGGAARDDDGDSEEDEDEVPEAWSQYAALVTAGVVLLKRLNDSSWVVQGWDERKRECTVCLYFVSALVLHWTDGEPMV